MESFAGDYGDNGLMTQQKYRALPNLKAVSDSFWEVVLTLGALIIQAISYDPLNV